MKKASLWGVTLNTPDGQSNFFAVLAPSSQDACDIVVDYNHHVGASDDMCSVEPLDSILAYQFSNIAMLTTL